MRWEGMQHAWERILVGKRGEDHFGYEVVDGRI
jgi:hypothetical protein